MDPNQPLQLPERTESASPLSQNASPAVVSQDLPLDSALNNLDPKVLTVITLPALERKVEDLMFQYSYPVCSHIWLDEKQKIQICTNPAGLSTKHEGSGRCAQHEGAVFRARSPYVQHLRQYSSLQQIFETFQNREKRLNDLSDEISLARTVLSMQLKRFEDKKNASNDAVFDKVLYALELIRKIAETIAKIHLTEATGITLQSITTFIWQISEILNQEIVEPNHRVRILDRIATEASFSP